MRCVAVCRLLMLAWLPCVFAAAPEAPDATPREAFDLWEIQVEGNTLLPSSDIERAVYGHLGERRTIDDVTAAQQQLEALYHSRGYGTVLVDIPEQDVVGGVVRLRVTEAAVSRLKVTGSRYFSLGRIKAAVPSLAEGSVPNLPVVQRELAALANTSSDRRITPVLKPAKTPGKLEVELKVKDELPLHGSVEVNDRYSADTTRLRVSGSLRYDNLWQRGHSLGVSYLASPEDASQVEVVSANYLWRFEHLDHLLSLYAVRSNSDIATIGTLGVNGKGTIAGARYTVPLTPAGNWYHSVVLGFDFKDFGESIALQGNDAVNAPISYSMFSAGYNATWLGESQLSHLDLTANVGPRGLGNQQGEFSRKRYKAIPNFAYLHLALDQERKLSAGLSLFGRLEAQVANSPLISNESYAAGGLENARGYLESEKQGDDALGLSFEMRYAIPPPGVLQALSRLDVFAFMDATGLRVRQPLPGSPDSALLWSTGLGLRIAGYERLNAMLAWATALRDSERTRAGDNRIHFSLGYDF